GTHAPQSMHSSGWMYNILLASNVASSLRGWMQSTGHTSTQAVSLVPTQGSQMMYATLQPLLDGGFSKRTHEYNSAGLARRTPASPPFFPSGAGVTRFGTRRGASLQPEAVRIP